MTSVPMNEEAERNLLGAIILNPSAIKRQETETLRIDDFCLLLHRRIYSAMLALWENDVPIEPLSLIEQLRTAKHLNAVGGAEYISTLIDGLPEHEHVETYVRIIREKSLARSAIAIGESMAADVSKYPEQTPHILQTAMERITGLQLETLPEAELFVPWSKFRQHGSDEVAWLVDKIVEQGTNGFLLGLPKSRKSLSAVDLAIALASATPWLGFGTKRRKVGIISREDFAGTTARRIKRAIRGRDLDPNEPWWDEYLFMNSRAEAQHLMLTDMRCLRSVIKGLKAHGTEFLFLDVLKVLHDSDENDSQEMGKVLKCVERISGEVGCQICVVHHSRKNWDYGMSLSEITRGSSVIAGFAEFLIGMRLVDEEKKVIQAKFETKADISPPSIYWMVDNWEERQSARLKRMPEDYQPPKSGGKYGGGGAGKK